MNSNLEIASGIYESQAYQKLKSMPGLSSVKDKLDEIIALAVVGRARYQAGLEKSDQKVNMVFKGNPGTGKTTAANLIGEVLQKAGVLSKGHVVFTSRVNYVSRYQGEMEHNIKKHVEMAHGGILFIDEVYSLVGRPDDQGHQGITTLLQEIENAPSDFMCIIAGYTEETNKFLSKNPGLNSRFSIQLEFDDYSNSEIIAIASKMAGERGYILNDAANKKIIEIIELERKSKHFGNARSVRNIIESAMRAHAIRVFNLTDNINGLTFRQLTDILPEDIESYTPNILDESNINDFDTHEEMQKLVLENLRKDGGSKNGALSIIKKWNLFSRNKNGKQ